MKNIKKIIRDNTFLNGIAKEFVIEYRIRKRNYLLRNRIENDYKSAMKQLKKINPEKQYVFFCGIPTHNNMGDQAQKYCIERWIKKNIKGYPMIEFSTLPFYSKTFRKELERRVSKDCIFIIQSGYCTTSTHIDHFMHKYIVKTFDNPILIMPQTILYNRKSDIRRTNKVYSSNDKLLFLARDEKSFQDAKKYFPSIRIMKYPDIVTTLIGSEEFQFNQDREGILICVRNDSEKKYSDEEINGLKNRLEKEGIFCEICDTNTELSAKELEKQFEEELKRQIAFFGRHKVVITDRYHGTIFAMISNTPVIVLSTLDHKVKTGIQWFDGVYDGSSYSSDSIEEAYHLAKEIMKDYREIDNGAYFQTEYYDKLYSAFKHE